MGTGLPNRWRYQHRTPTTQGYQSEDDPLEFDNYVADWLGPDDNVESCSEEEVAEQVTWEEQVELAQLRRHKRATQIRHGPIVMPEGYTPLKHRYSLRGPAPGVGFRRRTDYADDPRGLQTDHGQMAGLDGRLAQREVNNNDIPADGIGIEILRGTRELSGRRLPRDLRGIRTEENEFPYRNPMTEVLGNHETVLDHYRKRWYLREDKRKEFLEKRRVHYANREAFRRASYYDPEVERVRDMMWEDWVTLWYERLQWDIGYDPEVPEKFPNYRRRDDEDEGGPGAGP